MARLTPEAWASKMNKNIAALTGQKKAYQELAFEAIRKADKRIFDQGKDKTDSGIIGTYSPKEIYINPNSPLNPKKFSQKGKNSKKSTFKNGKPRKSGWFANYGEYKQKIGRGSGNKVNLQLSKAFRRGFLTRSFPITTSGGVMIMSIGVRSSGVNSPGKLEGIMVDKYPQAFGFTPGEKRFIIQELRKIFVKAIAA